MICSSKNEFMNSLYSRLRTLNVPENEAKEILTDFEQHFTAGMEQGLSEGQVCEKLGDIEEIAKQYIEEEPELAEKNSGDVHLEDMSWEKETAPPPNQQDNGFENNGGQNYQYANANTGGNSGQNGGNAGNNYNYNGNTVPDRELSVGGLIGIILLDIFVFSWALPSLASVIIGYCAVPVALIAGGITLFLESLMSFFGWNILFVSSPFVPVSNIFLALIMISIGGFAVMLAIVIIKGFIKIVKGVINLHGIMTVGKPVFKKKSKGVTA